MPHVQRMGLAVTAKNQLPDVPAALADAALIDGPTCAAAAAISISSWHDLVRAKAAPQPVIRRPRCTRWRLADVRAWLIERAAQGTDDATKCRVMAQAKKASAAASAMRRGLS
jgi:predicted DNA-binding transcriptional regulator AlpA